MVPWYNTAATATAVLFIELIVISVYNLDDGIDLESRVRIFGLTDV